MNDKNKNKIKKENKKNYRWKLINFVIYLYIIFFWFYLMFNKNNELVYLNAC